MGRYDSIKNPFSYRMVEWALRKTNNQVEQLAKSLPAHVVQIEKDFVHLAFETRNNIFNMPVVKMPQSFSGYGRDPTQVKDLGYAVPGQYYMGGVSGFAGGNTSFFPRGNLASLSFQPVSNTNASTRDYDQHTHTGGPNGWISKVMDQTGMQENAQNAGGNGSGTIGTASTSAQRTQRPLSRAEIRAMQRLSYPQAAKLRATVAPLDTSSTGGSSGSSGQSGQSQQNQSKTLYSFDKNDLCTIQSKDTDHNITIDSQNKKMTLNVPVKEKIYVGGDGKQGKYAQLVTTAGPVVNALGRYA